MTTFGCKESITEQIIKVDFEFKQYQHILSQISNETNIKDLDNADLQRYGINNREDRKQIIKIIKKIVGDDKKHESKEYKEVKQYFKKKMEALIKDKTKQDLKIESGNLDCNGFKDIDDEKTIIQKDIGNIHCEPLKRMTVILDVYDKFIKGRLWGKVSITSLMTIDDKYSEQQIAEDFLHIHNIHCHGGVYKPQKIHKTLKHILCEKFIELFKCQHIQRCNAHKRHYRNRNVENEKELYYRKLPKLSRSKSMEIINEKDIVFQQECDKIHAYFLHPPEIYEDAIGRHKDDNTQNELQSVKTKRKKMIYIGKDEDEKWFRQISVNEECKQTQDEMYRLLVQKMGIFRWQNAHGFRLGQNRGIGQLKSKYSNIKEEALNNDYHPLSKDNWNQTLRKSKIFYQSWAKQKIRTKYDGYFDDRVTGQTAEWKKGITISLQEVVTLKLYTDFDKLQFALKKCFRFESIADILDDGEHDEQSIDDLENRIKQFFHWRGGLMIVLNKFGTKLNEKNNMTLYHGVNRKLIVHPTQTFAFYGPLSTTTSEHVAKSFATDKGMVLKIKSYFPRLNYCNAFDASSISDYPEEQEWLVGFMYVGVLEVKTRKLFNKRPESIMDILKVPMPSLYREEFFALHLFGEQMFSMSPHSEQMLAQYLRCNRYECCKNKDKYDTKMEDYGFNKRLEGHCYFGAKHREILPPKINDDNKKQIDISLSKLSEEEKKEQMEDLERITTKICPLFWAKFEYFRKYPNRRQSVKFDNISDYLKRFFMSEIDEIDIETEEKKWIISFEEIIRIYENVKEIHFLNEYKLDNNVLKRLIKQIKKKDNKLVKVIFSYYNYIETDKNDKIFYNPQYLDKNMLNELKHQLKDKWDIKYGKTAQTGYKICIFNTSI